MTYGTDAADVCGPENCTVANSSSAHTVPSPSLRTGPIVPGMSSTPPLVVNPPGRSLTLYFPDTKPTLLLAIIKHKFDPGQLFKINPQLKDKPKDMHLQLLDMGVLIKAEKDASPKEYPSFQSLHDPLHIYFNILMHNLIAAGNQLSLIQFTHGSCKYISGLYRLYLKYKWPQVLEYHLKFHNH